MAENEDPPSKEEPAPVIFVQGQDPGEGYLRMVGNFEKMGEIGGGRNISFKEIYDVMFSTGRSTFLEEYLEIKKANQEEIQERQFRIVGLTCELRPLLVVFTVRDDGLAKRVITSWQVSRKSDEYKKLLDDCPDLLAEVNAKDAKS